MNNITYLLGAGASANAIPVLAKFNKGIESTSKHLKDYLREELNDEAFASLPLKLKEDNPILKTIIGELEWLLKEVKIHQTVDTLAKKFYLISDFQNLKKIKKSFNNLFYSLSSGWNSR